MRTFWLNPPPQGLHFHPSVPLNRLRTGLCFWTWHAFGMLGRWRPHAGAWSESGEAGLGEGPLGAPILGGSNKQQIHGNFEGFLLNNKQHIYELRGMPFWWSFTCFTLENFAFFSATEGPHQQDLSGWTMANISDGSHHPKPNTSGLLTPGMSVIRRWNHFAK